MAKRSSLKTGTVIEKFGDGYALITDWLKKEGLEIKDALEILIQARKKEVVQKIENKAGKILKPARRAKTDLEKRVKRIHAALGKKAAGKKVVKKKVVKKK